MENIILIGHGSPRKEANRLEVVANFLHKTIHPGCNDHCVRSAYMQFASPDIPETIRACIESGAKKIIIHPFFLSSGMHVTKDIPEMISEAKAEHPDLEFIYTEPLGVHEDLAGIVLERIHSATFSVPEDIEKRSFDIIGGEIDFSHTPQEQVPVIKRVIHATADFDFMKSLLFHPDAIRTGIKAIREGKDILTDVEMVRTGISKRRLERWGGKVLCNIDSPDLKDLSHHPSSEELTAQRAIKTRAESGIESALRENRNIGIIAVGNAPTALLKAIELLTGKDVPKYSSVNSMPLVVGVPVGFVKALESKSLLAAQSFPFITNLSRKGGTPVAVAVVNALLKMAEEEQ